MAGISSSSFRIPLTQVQKLDIPAHSIRQATDEEKATIQSLMSAQSKPMPKPEQADNHASNTYATVKVKGKVVATLYNSGAAETSNANYGKVKNLPSMGEAEKLTGPALAEKRAAEIAATLGGSVEKASTALNQAQWQSRRTTTQSANDYSALDAAINSATAKTRFETQAIAQDETVDISDDISSDESSMAERAKKEFLEFMDQTTEEKYLDLILKEMGITKEELAAMPPEERMEIMEKIKERIKEKTEKEAGIPADDTALQSAATGL